MKAILLNQTGSVENFIFQDIDKPVIKANEVLIETKSIGINPVDFKVRAIEDVLKMIYGDEKPAIIGWDISGIVVAVGDEVTKFKQGDHVFGMVNFPGAGHAYAEFVASPENHLAKMPDNTSFEEAAATTLAALTALQVMKDKVKKDDRILIHAGSGGVGHFAIQIAKTMGAYVISTSSAKNKDFIMSLGADQHVDYNAEAFQEVLSDIDFVFDMFNGEVLLNSVKVVKEGGTVISLPSPEFSEEIQNLAKEKNVHLAFQLVESNGDDMHALKEMLESGKLKPHVSQRFNFAEMGKAHQQLESGRTKGKVIVNL